MILAFKLVAIKHYISCILITFMEEGNLTYCIIRILFIDALL